MAPRIHAKTEEERKARKRERARLRQQKCRKRKKEAALKRQRELSMPEPSLDQNDSTTAEDTKEVSLQVFQQDTTSEVMPPLVDPVSSHVGTCDVPSSSPVDLKDRSSSIGSCLSDSSQATSCSGLPSSPMKQGLNHSHESSSSLSLQVTGPVPNSFTALEQRQQCSSSPDTIARFPLSTEYSPRQMNASKQPKVLSTVVSFGLPQPIYISTPERFNDTNGSSSPTASPNEQENDEADYSQHISIRAPNTTFESKLLYPEELTTPKPNPEEDLESVANAMLSLGRDETPSPNSMCSTKGEEGVLSPSSSNQSSSLAKGNLPLMPEDSFFAQLQHQQKGEQQREQQQQRRQQQERQQQHFNQQFYNKPHPPSIYAPYSYHSEGMIGMAHRMKNNHAATSSQHGILPPSSSSVAIHPQSRPGSFLTYRF